MTDKDILTKRKKDHAVNRILAAITARGVVSNSAKLLLYGTAVATIYAIAYGNPLIAVSISPLLARLIESIGSNTLSSLIDKVADDKTETLSPDEIRQLVENTFAKIQPSDYLTETEFYKTIRILEARTIDRQLNLKHEFTNQNQELQEIRKTLQTFIDEVSEHLKSNSFIPAVSPIPPRNLVGRRDIIETIKNALKSDRYEVVVVNGVGGSGRTALAQQIAYEVSSDFPGGVFWGTLETEVALKNTLYAWGQICGHDLTLEVDVHSLSIALRSFLEKRLQEKGRFLVVLNGDYLSDYEMEDLLRNVVPVNIPVLITSRRRGILQALALYIELPPLSRSESLLLLRFYAGDQIVDSDINSAEILLEYLYGLPLGIEIVGSNIARLSRKPGFQLKSYVDNFVERRKAQNWYGGWVSAAFSISYELLPERDRKLFRWISVFRQGNFRTSNVAQLLGWDLLETESILDNLVYLNLASWTEVPGEYKLHPIVQNYANHLLESSGEVESATQSLMNIVINS